VKAKRAREAMENRNDMVEGKRGKKNRASPPLMDDLPGVKQIGF
jgi:hypothetical protein